MSEATTGGDSGALRTWWASLLAGATPGTDARALWFGLFESDNGTLFYVQGYADFDANDETAEWASDEPSWAPDGRYVELPSLQSASWEHALNLALGLLRELAPWETWPGNLDGIAAGFDDGDAHLIWTRSA
jgi:hypothetical protein